MLPFYPTSAEEWQNAALVLTVAAFTLAFAAAATNAALTWKVNKTKKEETRLKDDNIAQEFKAKEVLIANAEQRASEANAKAAEANKGLAESNEEIARLTAETEQAKLERAEANKQIAIAKADAALATQRTAEISLKVEEESRKRAEAQLALLELQQRVAPRTITAEKRAKMLEILKPEPKGTIEITWVLGNDEAADFSSQIAEVLRSYLKSQALAKRRSMSRVMEM